MTTGGQRLLTRDSVVLLGASFFYLTSTMLVNPLVTSFAGTLGAGAMLMGALASLMNLCSLVVRPLAGNLADRLPLRTLAAVGASIMCVTALGQALAPSTAFLAVARLANGAGYSLCSVCMSTWFAVMLPPERVGQGMGLFGLMNALGMAVGPALGIAVSESAGYRVAICLAALFALVALIGIGLVRQGGGSPASHEGVDRHGGGDGVLHLVDRRAVPPALVVAFFTIPYMATQSFLVRYVQDLGLDISTGLFFTFYAASLVVLRIALGRAFDTVGFTRFLAASSVSALGSLSLLAMMTDDWQLFLAAPLMAGGYGVMCSVCQSSAVRLVGPAHSGMANSTYYMGLDVGMTLGPTLGGVLYGTVGPSGFFLALMASIPLALTAFVASSRTLIRRGPSR